MAVAFVTPLALGLVPRLQVPAVVVEIVLGIIIGPDVLGWASADEPVRILSIVGLAFLLFLAGLVKSPLLAAVILTSTSLGLVIPVLKEGGHSESQLGQLV